MGYLQNTWLSYADRTYQQIKEQVLTIMQYRVSEITDHTESNPFVKSISIWSAIAEMIGYYIDNAAREAHLDSCRLYSSAISHARRADYRVLGKLAGNLTVQFTLSAAIATDYTIPAGTQVKCSVTGVIFTTRDNIVITAGQTSATGYAIQYAQVTALQLTGATTGLPDCELIVGTDVTDFTTEVTINGVIWTRQETLAFSLPTDKHYVETVDANYNQVIIFGDGISGAIPDSGYNPVVNYKATLGDQGIADVGDVDTIVTNLAPPTGATLTVTNTTIAIGGSDVDSLDKIKQRVPKMNRTKDRAVTPDDYIDVAEMAPGVEKAGLDFQCGKTVDVFIVGIGGGLATDVLIESTQQWFDTRKMLTTFVNILTAGEIRIKLGITVRALPQYRNSDVINNVKNILTTFGGYQNQKINGQVQLGDIYQQVENTEGVDYSQVTVMTPLPYARPLDGLSDQLNWTREIKPGSTATIAWKIVFLGPDTFEVLKNNGYLGQFSVGSQIQQPEVYFTINQNYAQGNTWTFYTYAYFGPIVLSEPSIPAIYADDIDLIVTGGL